MTPRRNSYLGDMPREPDSKNGSRTGWKAGHVPRQRPTESHRETLHAADLAPALQYLAPAIHRASKNLGGLTEGPYLSSAGTGRAWNCNPQVARRDSAPGGL